MRLNMLILLNTIGYKKTSLLTMNGQISTFTFCGDLEYFYIPQGTLVYFDPYWADFYETKPDLTNPYGLPVY